MDNKNLEDFCAILTVSLLLILGVRMTTPKRVHLSIEKKIEILDLLNKTKSRKDVCRLYNLAPSSLQTYMRNEARIREEFDKKRDSSRSVPRKSPQDSLEQKLIQWMKTLRDNNFPIHGKLVREKALELASSMGLKTFQATTHWLAGFRKRENLNFLV